MSWEFSSELQHQIKDPIDSYKTSQLKTMIDEVTSSGMVYQQNLQDIIQNGKNEEFQAAIPRIVQQLRKEESLVLINNKQLQYRLIRLSYKQYQQLQARPGQQEYILFILSLLAEMVRRQRKIRLPFSKKIVLSWLSFDQEFLSGEKIGSKVITILLVLFENMVKQTRLMVRLGVEQQLKRGLLLLVSKVEELSALQISLRALLDLQIKARIKITAQQVQNLQLTRQMRELLGQFSVAKIRNKICSRKERACKQVYGLTLSQLISHK